MLRLFFKITKTNLRNVQKMEKFSIDVEKLINSNSSNLMIF